MRSALRRRLLALLLVVVASILAWLRRKRLCTKASVMTVEEAANVEVQHLAPVETGAAEEPSTAHLVRSTTVKSRPAEADEDSFAAFLSHYKIEAATEARWLQENLEAMLGRRCFLDSGDCREVRT